MPKSPENDAIEAYLSAQFDALYRRARARHGDTIQAFWMNEAPDCPGCGNEIDLVEQDGEKMLSLNAFMYRERGVLIGYALCAACAGQIMKVGRFNPFRQTPLHAKIEQNLIAAYKTFLELLAG